MFWMLFFFNLGFALYLYWEIKMNIWTSHLLLETLIYISEHFRLILGRPLFWKRVFPGLFFINSNCSILCSFANIRWFGTSSSHLFGSFSGQFAIKIYLITTTWGFHWPLICLLVDSFVHFQYLFYWRSPFIDSWLYLIWTWPRIYSLLLQQFSLSWVICKDGRDVTRFKFDMQREQNVLAVGKIRFA